MPVKKELTNPVQRLHDYLSWARRIDPNTKSLVALSKLVSLNQAADRSILMRKLGLLAGELEETESLLAGFSEIRRTRHEATLDRTERYSSTLSSWLVRGTGYPSASRNQ